MHPDDTPDFRVAVRGGHVHLNPWRPGLVGRGPSRSFARGVRVALADLRLEGDEAIVDPVPVGRWTPEADRVLVRWAVGVGLARVWFPDRVVDLAGEPLPEAAAVRCTTCGTRWEDDTLDFWSFVRSHHWYPSTCNVCGAALPEWHALGGAGADAAAMERVGHQRG